VTAGAERAPDARPRVALLVTCLVDVFEPEAGMATVELLEAVGYEVVVPLAQTCCGQPAWNSGFSPDAARVARTTLDALAAELDAGVEAVVVPAGSCATMVRRSWPELFDLVGDTATAARARAVAARTFELTEWLAGHPLPALATPEPQRVVWHHSCHLLRELGVRDQPLDLLDVVDGCERAEWADSERCCGFGGLFSVKLPETSEAMADQKLDSLADTGTDLVVGADSSCLVHLRTRAEARGRPIRTSHIAELLAAALPPPIDAPAEAAGDTPRHEPPQRPGTPE
jgi:L-lactate dehydrogenase complex protein LldE